MLLLAKWWVLVLAAGAWALDTPSSPVVTEVAALRDPWEEVYNDCLTTWSLPCIQRKLLLFVDRVGRLQSEL